MVAVSKDIHYKDLLRNMDCDILKFEVECESGLIKSLLTDVSDTCRVIGHPHTITAYEPHSQRDYTINLIYKHPGFYYVVISKVPVTRSLVFIEDAGYPTYVMSYERGIGTCLTPVSTTR